MHRPKIPHFLSATQVLVLVCGLTGCEDEPPPPFYAGDGGIVAPDGSVGGEQPRGPFDEDRIYLHGNVLPGMPLAGALDDFDPSTPPWVGLPTHAEVVHVRGTVGRVVYLLNGRVRVFEPDAWDVGDTAPPTNPLANDPVIRTGSCTDVVDLRIEPGTGDVLYACGTCAQPPCPVQRASGEAYPVPPDVFFSPGYEERMLVVRYDGTSGYNVFDDDVFTLVRRTDGALFRFAVEEIRPHASGFFVIAVDDGSDDQLALFEIGLDGRAVARGTYPLTSDVRSRPRLDGENRIYRIERTGQTYTVLRATPNAGVSEVIHTNAGNSVVQMEAASRLVGR